MELEVEAVVEAAAHVPTPMEEQTVEGRWYKEITHKGVSPIARQNVKNLIEEPDTSSC